MGICSHFTRHQIHRNLAEIWGSVNMFVQRPRSRPEMIHLPLLEIKKWRWPKSLNVKCHSNKMDRPARIKIKTRKWLICRAYRLILTLVNLLAASSITNWWEAWTVRFTSASTWRLYSNPLCLLLKGTLLPNLSLTLLWQICRKKLCSHQ